MQPRECLTFFWAILFRPGSQPGHSFECKVPQEESRTAGCAGKLIYSRSTIFWESVLKSSYALLTAPKCAPIAPSAGFKRKIGFLVSIAIGIKLW
jgi:hypothetical protein